MQVMPRIAVTVAKRGKISVCRAIFCGIMRLKELECIRYCSFWQG